MSKYDVIVIGSGPGGYVAAIRAFSIRNESWRSRES
jgi:pyruvate/2-oxoglutarate dehydrogenase complex dihydrolipoamide dehydrogenase (E3) component